MYQVTSMALEMKNTLAILSFLAIGLLVYPMISGGHWSELQFASNDQSYDSVRTSPLDWRALISE